MTKTEALKKLLDIKAEKEHEARKNGHINVVYLMEDILLIVQQIDSLA